MIKAGIFRKFSALVLIAAFTFGASHTWADNIGPGTEKETIQQAQKLATEALYKERPLYAATAGGRMSLPKEYKLANGLKVLILPHEEYPVVSCMVWYKVGSRNESPETSGLSHLVEHLLFNEVGSFQKGEIGAAIVKVGGQFNGFTSDDFTTFFETVPAAKLDLALKIEAERMRQAKISEAAVKQEIANIMAEFDREQTDPYALLARETRAAIFSQHPYKKPTLGIRSQVASIKAEQAKEFYDRYFWPDNAVLVLSGNITPQKALPLIEKFFGNIPASPAQITHQPIQQAAPDTEKKVNIKYKGNKEAVEIAYLAPAIESEDAAALIVLEKILDASSVARLKAKLVDTKLCSHVRATFEPKQDAGLFSLTCTALPGTANVQQKIIEAVDSTIAGLKESPVPESELTRAKNQALFTFLSERDGPYRASFHLGYFECLANWKAGYNWSTRLEAVTAGDISRVTKKYLAEENRVIACIDGMQSKTGATPATNSDTKPNKTEGNRLTGYKESDETKGPEQKDQNKTDEKEKPNTGIPAVIMNLPSAVGNVVKGDLPGAVGNVTGAIVNIPSALSDIITPVGTTVGTTASVIGKQIHQLIQGTDLPANPRISKRVMKNGLKVVIFESHISPVVQINGYIEAGSAHAPPGKPALPLCATTLFNNGSAKRHRPQLISQQEDRGIHPYHMLQFDNGEEIIDFSTRCLSKDTAEQLEILSETLRYPDLDEDAVNKLRQEVAILIKKQDEGISQKVDRVLTSNLLASTSPYYPASPINQLKYLDGLSLADLQTYINANVTPEDTAIIIAGDVDTEKTFALIDKTFGSWTGKSKDLTKHTQPNSKKILKTSVPIKNSRTSRICFGQLVPVSASHLGYGSLLLANTILAHHPIASRIEKRIAGDPEMLSVLGERQFDLKLEPLSNVTRWSLSLDVEPNSVPQTIKLIQSELRDFAKTGATAEDILNAKRYVIGSTAVKNASTLTGICRSMTESTFHTGIADAYTLQCHVIKAANQESVNRVVRHLFRPEQSTIIVAGASHAIKAARSQTLPDNQPKGASPAGTPGSKVADQTPGKLTM